MELKKAENKVPKSFWETYSAFANTDGGIVIFGIDEKSEEVTGVTDPYKLRDDLFNTLNNSNKVSENIISNKDVKMINIGKELHILVITIPEAPYNLKPIYLNGNPKEAYERLGEGDRKLSSEKYKALVVGAKKETDNELLKNYDLNDLDKDSLEIYRKELYEQSNNGKYKDIDFKDMLIELGAMRKDRQRNNEYLLTTGGLLFFGKYTSITDLFPGFQLDYFEKDSSLDTDWIDRVSTGDMEYPNLNVYKFFKIVLEKLNLTIKDTFILKEDSKTRLPYKSDLFTSVREALVNALMHSYYDSDKAIKITAYPDYYEFINPGKMRVTVEEFIHGGTSDIRNHTMSSIMRRIGISEKAGSGGPRIFDVAAKYKLKLPEVIRDQYSTSLRIWKVDLEKVIEKYPSPQKEILLYLINHYSISRGEAEKHLFVENYQFRVAINTLLEEGTVDVMGKGRSTRYVLKTSLSEYSYSMKRLLRAVEDGLIGRS
ncbi:ATPase AAA [Veillonella montpellierensis DNF00314]|uniref:ATPase AAA n=1 Tax=Veillonella montpellierensis DNF00314 TaxID=1401067 RepID=A0A096BXG4_9FIRM|nr:RNA-binding domain-containing protein [Veillonella montpellierensis]KGF47422.1 ATPase AAA [Veillonella montpellierensis DNF00314]